ncbi:hypothetical protein C0992_002289, partial [Termitomyces sp. T32_za158]
MVKLSCSTITRLPSTSLKKSTHLLCKLWRTQSHRIIQTLSTVQKAQKKLDCLIAKQSYQEALREAQGEVIKLAESLREQFQKHSVQYYLEEIMQIS